MSIFYLCELRSRVRIISIEDLRNCSRDVQPCGSSQMGSLLKVFSHAKQLRLKLNKEVSGHLNSSVAEKSGAEAILQLCWLTSFSLSVTICHIQLLSTIYSVTIYYLFSVVKKNHHAYEFSPK